MKNLLFFLLFINYLSTGQNLVQNSSFENITNQYVCDQAHILFKNESYSNMQKYFSRIAYWSCPEKKTACVSSVGSADVVCEAWRAITYHSPITGDKYGMTVNNEYLIGQLSTPLIKGKKYYIEYHVWYTNVSPSDGGIWFSVDKPKQCGRNLLEDAPKPDVAFNNSTNAKNDWKKITGYYTPTSDNIRHFALGDFNSKTSSWILWDDIVVREYDALQEPVVPIKKEFWCSGNLNGVENILPHGTRLVDDIANAYFNETIISQTTLRTFLSDGTKFNYQGDNGWWQSNSYHGSQIRGFVSGDFNGDSKDDTAIAYDYGSQETRIHVFLSDGTKFNVSGGSNGWWQSTAYAGSQIRGFVSGDFNSDGKDDTAIAYDYGSQETRIHVFLSDGTKFNVSGGSNGWWQSTAYAGSQVRGFVSGDFNGDGKDDTAIAYDYGSQETRIHVFLSDGTKFNVSGGSNGWWQSTAYAGSQIRGFVSGDFNGDGKDDNAIAYDYGSQETRIHVFLSDGTKFNVSGGSNGWWQSTAYAGSQIRGFVSGEFNGDGKVDTAIAYDYGSLKTRIHVFLSDGTKFNVSGGSNGWWQN